MPKSLSNTELVWVNQPNHLHHVAQELAAEEILAVDTESNSLYAFQEQVCIIQFSSHRKDYLIDAMVLSDLSPLKDIFENERILKVFHAAEYDLICLFRDYGFRFNHLFDTMIAARILGYDQVGLGSLLAQYFGISMNKKYQRANWGKRPLNPEMLEYARQDSHYLIALHQILREQLIKADLFELALEDFHRLTIGIEDTTETHENDFWKLQGARDLTPEKAAVLKSLYDFRQTTAETQNRPPFKVISNQALVEMANTCPRTCADLLKLPTLHERQAKRYARGLLTAIRVGKQAEPLQPPNHTRPKNALLERIEALQDWRKHMGRSLSVPSDVVLPRDVLIRIAWAHPQDISALESEMSDVPYRFNRFGVQILSKLNKVGKKQ